MQRSYLKISGVTLSYLEANSTCQATIVFIHGNSGSAQNWLHQLEALELDRFRMIAFDLPAHGLSSGSQNPEMDYSLPGLGSLISQAIFELVKNQKFIIVGFSLGSNILAECLSLLPTSPSGLVLAGSSVAGGMHTPDKIYLPAVDATVFFSDNASEAAIAEFAMNMTTNPSAEARQQLIEDYKAVKKGFRPTFAETVAKREFSNEIAILQSSKISVLVVFGAEEKIANPNYLDDLPFPTWQNTIHKLPDAGHMVFADQTEKFNQLLSEYSKGYTSYTISPLFLFV